MSEWIELPRLSLASPRYERIVGPFRLRVELLTLWSVEQLTVSGESGGSIECGLADDFESAKAEAEDCLRQRLTEWLAEL